MKRILTLVFALIAFSSYAQKGTILLGGNASYEREKNPLNTSYNTDYLTLSPMLGYQFHDKMTVGLYGDYRLNDDKFKKGELGAFLRHSILNGNVFGVYADLKAGTLLSKNDIPGFAVSLTPQISINVNKGFALNFGFGGLKYSSSESNDLQTREFDFKFGNVVNIGVSKNFGCKKCAKGCTKACCTK